jgi:hypothetical protein
MMEDGTDMTEAEDMKNVMRTGDKRRRYLRASMKTRIDDRTIAPNLPPLLHGEVQTAV